MVDISFLDTSCFLTWNWDLTCDHTCRYTIEMQSTDCFLRNRNERNRNERNQPTPWKVLSTTVFSTYEYNELVAGYRYDFRIKAVLHPDVDPIYTSCFVNSRYVVNTLGAETFASRNFREFREFCPNSRKFKTRKILY